MAKKLKPATITALVLLVAGSLTLPPVASAHTLSLHRARAVALDAGRKMAKETGAYKTRVSSCRRRSSHRIDCKVENIYRSGSANCTTDIEVRFASRTSSRVRSTAHGTLCF
jgi:hypothetical protein